MLLCPMRTCVLALVVVAPSAVQAQRIATRVTPTNVSQLRVGRFGWLEALTMNSGAGVPRLLAQGTADRRAVGEADSIASRETNAEAGAVVGGLAGAIVGGLAFAHWTHRAGAVNSGTGTLGGALVGAGLVGGLGALAGLLIGSGIPH